MSSYSGWSHQDVWTEQEKINLANWPVRDGVRCPWELKAISKYGKVWDIWGTTSEQSYTVRRRSTLASLGFVLPQAADKQSVNIPFVLHEIGIGTDFISAANLTLNLNDGK